MPIKVPCRFPGCPNLLDDYGYCSVHAKHGQRVRQDQDKRRMQDKDTAYAFKFRSSRQWKRLRKVKLSMNPICEDPFKDHQRLRTTGNGDQVHHIKSIKEAPELKAELDNLMTVCHKCHAKFNAQERVEQDRP